MSAPRRQRLDAELVRRGLARSRAQASELVTAGRVSVAGARATKPATQVESAAAIEVAAGAAGEDAGWASRGAHKLRGALDAFGVDPAGRWCLDAGASTGGFTDVLLRAGARGVLAVDVGYGQLVWRLQSDPRVRVLDRTNVRDLTPDQARGPDGELPALVVSDLSFIPLALVLPALAACTDPAGQLLLMVKPQFEVGRERLGAGGVVRDPRLRAAAVRGVIAAAAERGLRCAGVAASPLPGPSGNVEYFVRLVAGGALTTEEAAELVDAAVAAGPTGAA